MVSNEAPLTVGRYLAARLRQCGAAHAFGVPGDFTLALLDELLAAPGDGSPALQWVGSSNELNAAYAADGYARVGRTMGAIVTTYGVGELSAINGIAGAFAEDVPVVSIVGMPATGALGSGALLHHSLLDGDHEHFVRVFREVTAAQAVLISGSAAVEIDRVLTVALSTSKPVYLGIPTDVAVAELAPEDAARLAEPLRPRASDPGALAAFERALAQAVAHVPSDTGEGEPVVTVLAGPRIHRCGVEADVAALAALPGVRIASQVGSKAVIDEDHPASLGTYMGAITQREATRRAVDEATLLIMIGTVVSDFTTGFFTQGFDPAAAVELALDHARVGYAVFADVRLDDAIAALDRVIAAATLPASSDAVAPLATVAPPSDDDAPLDHAALWAEVQAWLPPDTTLIAEAGTAFYGALDLTLPDRCDLLGQPVWSSIGYTIPATLGAGLARPQRRPVLIIGDGAAQLTVQELGQVFHHGLAPVILLIDNAGYTVERMIRSPEAVYQDVVAWNWRLIPAALGGAHVHVRRAPTVGDLRSVLADATAMPEVPVFAHLTLPRDDAPRLLVELARRLGNRPAALQEHA
ncbi:alpha-keto acid decarboxylase family protein [Microcella frigidaquae]|uniref:Alpha-keto-acid decarboxylase n=1 Tax=Microcella frigidaquae TaxID=424758 RepID=A0A840X5U3_9MICO|nr:thiamine pyrophosphate-binding protein [Microcella frigidaquae]MBB5617581.1 indolepyruvate decarboxylase [Microcella frigidaquae]NHN45755.1 alpha-keto acid decarboxylase family protein [Microcella frigidaquae]